MFFWPTKGVNEDISEDQAEGAVDFNPIVGTLGFNKWKAGSSYTRFADGK